MAANDLVLTAGDARLVRLTFTVADEASRRPVPYLIDPVLHEVRFTVRRVPPDSPIVVQKKLSTGEIVVRDAPHANVVDVRLAPGDTAGLDGTFWFDAEVTVLASRDPATAVKARLTVVPGVS